MNNNLWEQFSSFYVAMSVRASLCGAFNYERHVPSERYYVPALDVLLFSHAGLSYVVHTAGQRACNFLSTHNQRFDFPHRARRQSAALTQLILRSPEMWFIILIISHSKWKFHHTFCNKILIHRRGNQWNAFHTTDRSFTSISKHQKLVYSHQNKEISTLLRLPLFNKRL